jgi:penicillin-binding protein 1A
VNLATGQGGSGRQAGSAFKVFTLAAAMKAGYRLDSYWVGPQTITIGDPQCAGRGGAPWVVSNAGDGEAGTFTLASATADSVNTVFAQLVTQVKPEAVVKVAEKMGIKSPLKPQCSITLGAQAINPLEMTAAYATLANKGVYHEPTPVERITTPDQTRLHFPLRTRTAIPENDANLVTYALQGVVTSGTGTAAALSDGRPVAGKTGTAQNYADAWFCGYTPQLATCVWVGYPKEEKPLLNIQDGSSTVGTVYGGTIPAEIWHDFMSDALDGARVIDFTHPDFSTQTEGNQAPPTTEPSPTETRSPRPGPSPSETPPRPSPRPSPKPKPKPKPKPT